MILYLTKKLTYSNKMSVTGNPKIDIQILNKLYNNELKQVSHHNRYVNSIYRSDLLWKERILCK